jgi:hypothetical protein
MKTRILYRLLIMICCIGFPLVTLAQGPPDPQDAPIDGGLSILLAAGVGYGVKKYREKKKMKSLDEGNQADK